MFQVELEFFFVEGGKLEYPKKIPRSRDENRQQTQPTFATRNSFSGRNNLETKHLFQPTYMTERIIKLMYYINNLVND